MTSEPSNGHSPDLDWEGQKENILRLYLVNGQHLRGKAGVIETMKKEFHFPAR